MTGTPTSSSPVLIQSDSLGTALAGDGVSGFYIWGAQLEAGSFATSYIPTISGTVSRAADQASITGTNFSSWYNQSEGSLYCEGDTKTASTVAAYAALNDTSYNMYYRLGRNYANLANGSTTVTLDVGATSGKKLAMSAIAGAFKFTADGSIAVSSSLVTTMPAPTQMVIGNLMQSNTGSNINGHIKKLSYYPKALSSIELQGLTQP